mmetsp:Transcript_61741/g.108136  ORF Transcript_61741/g.108136 Transcript_61741/m.108136 type:complete len:184 (-) Transcript_61741:63-614(-)
MGDLGPVSRRHIRPAPKEVANLKVLVSGDAQVGKTALVRSFCDQVAFSSRYQPTIGVDFNVASFEHKGKHVRMNIFDLGGSSEFAEVRDEFYKESQGGILAFDVTARKTFQNLEAWLSEANKWSMGDVRWVVVGTKVESGPRVINEQTARDWAKAKGLPYFEVSVAQGKNVESPFKHLASCLA